MAITPVVLGYGGRLVGPHWADWQRMNEAASDWYLAHVGCAPLVGSPEGVVVPDAPTGPSAHDPTLTQALALVRAHLGELRTYSVVGLGVGSGDGASNYRDCLISEQPLVNWADPAYPFRRTSLWLLLHEWGHMAGLLHPYAVWRRDDTIMGYGSTGRFEAGEDVGFTAAELAVMQANPLWMERLPMPDTWYPGAIRRDGPGAKVWPDVNVRRGAILHSMEGSIAGALRVLDGPAQASWHFSVQTNGLVQQHYPIEASPWHAGNLQGNVTLIGIEHEGAVGEALTVPQREASTALVAWLGQTCGWVPSRDPAGRTLWEHREVGRTTCPNGRIPWEFYAPAEVPPEEEPVEVKALSQGETIATADAIFRRFGAIIADTEGETMEEIIDPAPPPGYRDVRIRFKE